jgi:hypothetical protein
MYLLHILLFCLAICSYLNQFYSAKASNLQAKLLKMRALLALKEYSSVISETGYILKQDEDNLEALLLRGRAYYYLSDHDVAMRFILF